MEPGGILQLGAQFGSLGVLVAYLLIRDTRHDKWRQKHEEERASVEARHREEKMALDRERIAELRADTASREKQTAAVTGLALVVERLASRA